MDLDCKYRRSGEAKKIDGKIGNISLSIRIFGLNNIFIDIFYIHC